MKHGRALGLLLVAGSLFYSAPTRAQGGPDAFGYTWDSTAFDWVDPSLGGSDLGITADDQEIEVALPWSFFFYGTAFDYVTVSDNGALRLSDGTAALDISYANVAFPSAGSADADIAVFWDDLNISQAGVIYTQHHIPSDRFVISWVGLPHFSYGGAVSFQVHLQPSGHLEFHFLDVEFGTSTVDSGASATVGLQDLVGGGSEAGNFLEVSSFAPTILVQSGYAITSPCTDVDGDGHAAMGDPTCGGTDCNDSDPSVYYGAPETCADGIDQDCNGYDQLTDFDLDGDIGPLCGGEDCDDFDATVDSVTDGDGDGYASCDDCDDTSASTSPGAVELCDGTDNDCDGTADDLADADGDGVTVCGGDCDDADALSWPGTSEVCGDGSDNDCDGTPENLDADGDGYVDEVCGGADCDDSDAAINPLATEICDSIDSDCDGLSDELDLDIGGMSTPFSATTTAPVVMDASLSGISVFTSDINLISTSGGLLEDVDILVDIQHSWVSDLTISVTSPLGTSIVLSDQNGGDGDDYSSTSFDDEAISAISVGTAPFSGSYQPEVPLSSFDGQPMAGVWTLTVVDNFPTLDDGVILGWTISGTSLTTDDSDGDGAVDSCGDCDAGDDTVFPGALEICGDGLDQDCDGLDLAVDSDGDTYTAVECGGDDCDDEDALIYTGADWDFDGYDPCLGDCDDFDSAAYPDAPEICGDGTDQDCDGEDRLLDEDGDLDASVLCGGTDCDDTDPLILPTATDAACDGVDTDCDGLDLDADGDGDAPVACGGGDCDDGDSTASSLASEICDGNDVDNDCDGTSDAWDLDIGANPPSTSAVSSSTVPLVVTDSSPVADPLTINLTGIVVDVTVAVDVSHPRVGDISLSLESPTGVVVSLAAQVGGSGSDYSGTLFDDDALAPILAGAPPFTGSWSPVEPLSTFDGLPAAGDWTLHVSDGYAGESGSLDAWTLTVVSREVDDFDLDGSVGSCGDCDDANASIFPGALEVCADGLDQDCDGLDEPLADADADGYTTALCGGADCDDSDPSISPAATEVCGDGLDNDCDPATEDLYDSDGDGSDCSVDCDDSDPLSYPGFAELCFDPQDNDCDPTTTNQGGDLDGDGYSCTSGDCDDTNPDIYPMAPEILCTGIEEDCTESVNPDVDDGDGDGYSCISDCDDTLASTYPGALEIPCDGIDNDCDEEIDSDDGTDNDVDGDGATCDVDCDDQDPTRSPDFSEVCDDGIDNDCDPLTPDNLDADGDGMACDVDCDDADPLTYPGAPETCNDGIDQDCDGLADELADDVYVLDDSDSVHIDICSFDFPFCGTDWSSLYVQDNGRLTFGFDDPSSQESLGSFLAQTPEIAVLWTDLDPSLAGTVEVSELDGSSLEISFTAVPQFGEVGTANSFTVTLWADGQATIDYAALDADDGLVGFACGNTVVSSVDLSAAAGVVGQGTEDAVYELFSALGSPNDLENQSIDLCLSAGDDADLDGWSDDCGDCDDTDASRSPDAPELCDGIDNDCNGTIDDLDSDGDGSIDDDPICGGDDCDDSNPDIHPGATEVCNGVDDDCDGIIEVEGADEDGDSWPVCGGDCDDSNAAVHPGAEEICDLDPETGELIDNDCDGEANEGWVMDLDGDGYISEDLCEGGDDCADDRSNTYPGAPEICDLIDNDCNGEEDDIDADGDGEYDAACQGTDCNDSDPAINTEAEEVPYDGIDNDCSDGDETDVDGDGYDSDSIEGGLDCDDSTAELSPDSLEICDDGIDNDCDALMDIDDEECGSCANCGNNLGAGGSAGGSAPLLLLLALLGFGARRRRRPQAA